MIHVQNICISNTLMNSCGALVPVHVEAIFEFNMGMTHTVINNKTTTDKCIKLLLQKGTVLIL